MVPDNEAIMYDGPVTVVQDRETLTAVDDDTRQELEAAADAFVQSPANLRAAILAAGRRGERPADIVKAIKHVYTYDYVARLVREDRRRVQA
jgi:hypothetical protein